jgi:ABC-type Fe3+/spermidine/putrescine transport system ATPase subunit
MAYLELVDLTKEFGQTVAVAGLNLSIERGEFVSLLGGSGCGKTTTLRMIAGFTRPSRGKIFLDKEDISGVDARSRNMGMVFQTYALFPTLSVYENICFGLRVRRRSREEITRRVEELLALGHLEGMDDRYPAQLSGGQQQRVALLRALAIEPKVLLLDEPLSNLDAKLRVEIRKEIRRMQIQLAITTVYVTHDQEEALAISDRIAIMNSGVIQQVGTPLDIYQHPANQFVSSFVGRSNLLTCRVEPSGGLIWEDRPLGVRAPDDLRRSAELVVAFRPQNALVLRTTAGLRSPFQGLVLTGSHNLEVFLGTTFQIELSGPGGAVLLAEVPMEHWKDLRLQHGEEVVLAVPEEHLRYYEGQSPRRADE